MRVQRISTLDVELEFLDCEVENVRNKKQLDRKICQGKVITIIENEIEYNLIASYILFYQI